MNKNILYIGWCMPYDKVAHAGGQNFNFYIKEMAKRANVKLVTIALPGEKEHATVEKYGIDARYIEFSKISIWGKLTSINSKINPCHKYGHLITNYKANAVFREIICLKKEGYFPDIIVLQWTQMILLINDIKKIYPKVKYVAVEEDVTFLRLHRKMQQSKLFNKIYKNIVYKNETKREVDALKKFDLIYTNNHKDERLLIKHNINPHNIKVLVPYFHKYTTSRNYYSCKNDILFYGNMGRPENYNAAIWFIDNIMPQLIDENVRFVVVGGNEEKLSIYKSKKVIITGYVDNPSAFFEQSLMFVAPITQGAGIKIKILEAMSSGIPVITTNVGIEGIPAKNNHDYLYYDNNQELINSIKRLLHSTDLQVKIGQNGRKIINKYFDYDKSVEDYIITLLEM